MTIKELERRTGLPRTSIRFYEQEGLLTPERRENNYRTTPRTTCAPWKRSSCCGG